MADELNGAEAPEAPVEQQPVVQEAAPPSFRDRFEQAGYNLEGYDDDKLFEAVQHGLQRASRADELEPVVSQAQRYLDRAEEIEEFLRSKEQQAPAAKEEKPNRWKAPLDYDPEWEKFTQLDPSLGRYVLREEAQRYVSPAVAENMNKFKAWERENALHITRNFPDAVKEAVADLLAEQETKFDQRLQSHTQQMREMAQAQNYLKQHYKDFFHVDANGQPLVDQSGREAMTPKGQVFEHFVNEARSIGIKDQAKVLQYAETFTEQAMRTVEQREAAAKKAAKKEAAPVKAEPEVTPEQRNAQAKESFVRRAIRGSRIANLATPSAEADASALKERRGAPRPDFHEIRKALVEAQNN